MVNWHDVIRPEALKWMFVPGNMGTDIFRMSVQMWFGSSSGDHIRVRICIFKSLVGLCPLLFFGCWFVLLVCSG
ncbi:hypothetical protein Hanom_Chr10g00892461 [Helianthus anomalus]